VIQEKKKKGKYQPETDVGRHKKKTGFAKRREVPDKVAGGGMWGGGKKKLAGSRGKVFSYLGGV